MRRYFFYLLFSSKITDYLKDWNLHTPQALLSLCPITYPFLSVNMLTVLIWFLFLVTSTKWDPEGITHKSKCCDASKGAERMRETPGKIKLVSVRKGRF